jgi:hypothetical protein
MRRLLVRPVVSNSTVSPGSLRRRTHRLVGTHPSLCGIRTAPYAPARGIEICATHHTRTPGLRSLLAATSESGESRYRIGERALCHGNYRVERCRSADGATRPASESRLLAQRLTLSNLNLRTVSLGP